LRKGNGRQDAQSELPRNPDGRNLGFIGKKQKHTTQEERRDEWETCGRSLRLTRKARMVPCYCVGKRDSYHR
jgi:hypothetical protein